VTPSLRRKRNRDISLGLPDLNKGEFKLSVTVLYTHQTAEMAQEPGKSRKRDNQEFSHLSFTEEFAERLARQEERRRKTEDGPEKEERQQSNTRRKPWWRFWPDRNQFP
jgi:hypothetical protein